MSAFPRRACVCFAVLAAVSGVTVTRFRREAPPQAEAAIQATAA